MRATPPPKLLLLSLTCCLCGMSPAQAATVVDLIAGNPNLSTLATFLTGAGLTTTLGGTGPYTVWAPSNAAFAALPSYVVGYLKDPTNMDSLQALLKYHVSPSSVAVTSLSNGEKLTTLQGSDVFVAPLSATNTTLGLVSSTCQKGVVLTGAEASATNGMVQEIDQVLFPAGLFPNDFVFWVEQRGQERVGYSGYDCRAKGTDVLAFQTEKPVGLALDSNTEQLFWSNDQNAKPFDSYATSIDFSGANLDVFLTGLYDPQGMDTDTNAKKLYFTEHQGCKVHRCNYDGSDVETLKEFEPPNTWFPADVAVDPEEELVFMAVQSVPTELQGKIAVMFYNGTGYQDLVTGLHKNFGLCLDTRLKHVFYIEGGHGGSLNCLSYGSTPCKSKVLLDDLQYGYMCDVDNLFAAYGGPTNIVFSEASIPGNIYMVDSAGHNQVPIVANLSAPMGVKLGTVKVL